MKVVFVGPSLPDAAEHVRDVVIRHPATSGDVAKAVMDGATVIGIVDGYFENVASVWHKEILFALSEGVTVFGGASMGALRAAECAPFGMIGVGAVFRAYALGALIDDDAVGQVHGPAELGYVPLSEPLVNIAATLDRLRSDMLVTESEHRTTLEAAERLFFKSRTFANAIAGTNIESYRAEEIRRLCVERRRDLKCEDAMLLLARVEAADDRRHPPPTEWRFSETQMWTRLLEGWRRDQAAAAA